MINKFFIIFFCMLIISGLSGFAADEDRALWYHANDLADRLKSERWKYGVVREEIKRLEMAVSDLNDIQFYPSSVTKININAGEKIDKMLKRIRKKSKYSKELIDELEKPLEDGIMIAEEMLKESPNFDMISILIQDNISRIQQLINIKKYVDILWDDISLVMQKYEKMAGFERPKEQKGMFEESFFKVLISQIGQASDVFYKYLHNYKDSLVSLSDKNAWVLMAKLDLKNYKNRIERGDYAPVQRDLSRLSVRFRKKIPIGGVDYNLGRSFLLSEDFQKAVDAFGMVDSTSSYYPQSVIGLLQSLFALEEDQKVVSLYTNVASIIELPPKDFYEIKFLVIQSLYALGNDAEVEKLLLSFDKKNNLYYRSLVIYAKSLVRQKRDREASEILKSMIKQTQLPVEYKQDAILALAYLKYEQDFYQSALSDFNKLIDKPGYQPDALYGMVWCYVKMRDTKTAEFTLKNLVNQFPDSPLAMDGLLVLSKWRFLKAQKLWDYKISTEDNQSRLERYMAQIEMKVEGGQLSEEDADQVRQKLAMVKLTLASRVPVHINEIDALFTEALSLTKYVRKHYKTGVFSEVEFSGNRERALEKLDGLLGKSTQVKKNQIASDLLKRKIFESQMAEFEMTWQYKLWLNEYLSFTKEQNKFSKPDSGSTHVEDYAPDDSESRYILQKRISDRIVKNNEQCFVLVKDLITNPLSAEHRDKLLFYNGLVTFDRENIKNKMRLQQRNSLDSIFRANSESEPVRPDYLFENAQFEKLWTYLLKEYPDSEFTPMGLYYLGCAQLDQDDPNGVDALEAYIANYSKHRHYQHAMIRLGEYYYNHQRFEDAKKLFARTLRFPDSKYFNQALYLESWTFYSEGNFNKALKGFSYILNVLRLEKEGRMRSPLLDEVIRMLSICFAEIDNADDQTDKKLKDFIKKLDDKEIGARVLHHTAKVFRQQGRLTKSRRIIFSLVKQYPWYGDVPEAMMDLAVSYDVENRFQKAADIREKLFNDYNRNTDWYTSIKDGFYQKKADSLCEAALDKIAYHYFAKARLNKSGKTVSKDSIYNKAAYMKAINAYERFLDIYPDGPNAPRSFYLLGESYYAIKEYDKAAVMYLKATMVDKKDLRTAAAYNAVMAAQKNIEKLENEDK
ncbi:MAG: tetratricopeptide repeat protein [Fibrobacteria bacterium]|nr:tetratricopeptide repeat protein [Fibrobacteria bacterium]